jgi:hypothetical protein
VDTAHIVVLSAALLTLLCLPCVLTALLGGDEFTLRRAVEGRPESRPEVPCYDPHDLPRPRDVRDVRDVRNVRDLRRLDRALENAGPMPSLAHLDPPSIEQIAYDLRRLDRQRRTGPTLESELWLAAVLRAYDARLALACQCLGLDEHLQHLNGLDRQIERLRVEGELQAAGLALH